MSKVEKPRSRLGRGLSSLLSVSEPEETVSTAAGRNGANVGAVDGTAAAAPLPSGPEVIDLPLDQVRPNPHQPRRQFEAKSLADLAASLKSTGLIQPIIVRQAAGGFELIAGERRLRAAKIAGLSTLPAIVKEVDGYTQAQMALIENVQREDLNPIDRALAYRNLIQQLGLTHAELASRLGEDRTAISHFLRLLDLPEPVRELIRGGKLSVGHAKLLAGLDDPARQQRLAETVISEGLSVRNLERVLETLPSDRPPQASTTVVSPSAHLKDLEKSLSRQLGMRVQVRWSTKSKKGKLVIHYTLDQFDLLKSRLGIETD